MLRKGDPARCGAAARVPLLVQTSSHVADAGNAGRVARVGSSPASRLLTRGLLLAVLCLVIGGLLLIFNRVVAYVLLAAGVFLLMLVPTVAAVRGAQQQFHPDHKVEGRTFVIDLWRSIPHAGAHRRRDRSGPTT